MGLVLASCGGSSEVKTVERPNDLLNSEELISIIIDLQIIESHYQRRYSRPNLYKEALDSASYFVFEKHEISEDRFERSYEYYAHDVQTMYMIYEAALDSINMRISLNTDQNNQQQP